MHVRYSLLQKKPSYMPHVVFLEELKTGFRFEAGPDEQSTCGACTRDHTIIEHTHISLTSLKKQSLNKLRYLTRT